MDLLKVQLEMNLTLLFFRKNWDIMEGDFVNFTSEVWIVF